MILVCLLGYGFKAIEEKHTHGEKAYLKKSKGNNWLINSA